MADETAECTCDVDNGWPCDRHSTLTAGKVRLAAQTLVEAWHRSGNRIEEKGKMRAYLDRDQLICALVKADLATDFTDHRMRNRTNIEAAMIAADVVMRMLDQEKDSAQDRR